MTKKIFTKRRLSFVFLILGLIPITVCVLTILDTLRECADGSCEGVAGLFLLLISIIAIGVSVIPLNMAYRFNLSAFKSLQYPSSKMRLIELRLFYASMFMINMIILLILVSSSILPFIESLI